MIPLGATGHAVSSRSQLYVERMLTVYMILELAKEPFRQVELRDSKLVGILELPHTTQARRIAVVVCDHDGWIERLKVQNDERAAVECR
jgi:hypothetical protein